MAVDVNPFRRRKRLSVGTVLATPVGLSVVLTPDDFLSALPVEFGDEGVVITAGL
jgi:hypothetical protein